MDSQPARSALWAAANLPQWVRLTRDSAYLAGSTGVSLLAKLGLALTFAHLSTPAIYGQYRYLTTVLGVMTLTVLPGMTAAVIRASARGYDRTLEHAARARVPVSLVGSFVLLALAALYLVRGETVFGRALAVAALCFPLLASFDLYLPFLSGKGDFRRYALFQGLVKAAPIPVMVVVLIAGGRLEAIVLAWLAVTIGLHGLFFRETLRSAHPASEVDKEGLLYGRRVSVAYVISTGQTHLASLVAGALLGPVHLAVLSIGLVWWEVFRQATSLVSLQVLPRMAAACEDQARAILRRSLIIGTPVAALAGGVLILALPVLVPLLFTVQYRDSVLVGQILVAGAALAFPGNQASAFLAARARTRAQYWLFALTLLVELAGLALLVRPFGVVGVAMAKSAMRVFYSLLGTALASRVRG